MGLDLELDQDEFVQLLGKLIGEARYLQNNPWVVHRLLSIVKDEEPLLTGGTCHCILAAQSVCPSKIVPLAMCWTCYSLSAKSREVL
jgi:hypothetical protein